MGDIRKVGNTSSLEKVLNRYYLGKRSHYIEVGPERIILPGNFELYYERIQSFEVRDDDVFILAFPKTGSRWTQEMVWLLSNNLNFDQAREVPLNVRSPLLELEAVFNNLQPEEYKFQQVVDLKSPRCLKSHLHWTLLPKAMTNGCKQPKIIVILRGPEDVCISYYHQARVLEGFSGSLEHFCGLFLGGKVPFGPYWKHVNSLWQQKHRSNVLFIKYNQMIANLSETVRQVAQFLGKDVSDDEVVQLCRHLEFDNLKKSGGFNMEEMIGSKNGYVNPFMRNGKIGDHRNSMTGETIEAFSKQRNEYLIGTGLKFD